MYKHIHNYNHKYTHKNNHVYNHIFIHKHNHIHTYIYVHKVNPYKIQTKERAVECPYQRLKYFLRIFYRKTA